MVAFIIALVIVGGITWIIAKTLDFFDALKLQRYRHSLMTDAEIKEEARQVVETEVRSLKKVGRFTLYFFLAFFALIALLIGVPALLGY